MKEKKKKIFASALIIISIINVICVIIGCVFALAGNHSFNTSLSPSTSPILIFAILVVLLQFFNIIQLIILLKSDLTNKKQKVKVFLGILIVIITLFIPIKTTHSITYVHPNNNNNNLTLNPPNMGSTTHNIAYENLYGITLTHDQRTSLGIEIY